MDSNKRMLFIEFPPEATDVSTWVFKDWGFHVEYRQIVDLKEISGILHSYDLSEFDIILFQLTHLSMPKELFAPLKKLVRAAEKKKGAKIYLVGMADSLKPDHLPSQIELYEGLFIHRELTAEQMEVMFAGLSREPTKFNKRMLFIQRPPEFTDVDTLVFREMGFDVEFHRILRFEELLAIQKKYRVADFDVILLDTIYNSVPEDVLNSLKHVVQAAEEKKRGRIYLVGMALGLAAGQVPAQLTLYDDLFIHRWKAPEQVEAMFAGLFAEDHAPRRPGLQSLLAATLRRREGYERIDRNYVGRPVFGIWPFMYPNPVFGLARRGHDGAVSRIWAEWFDKAAVETTIQSILEKIAHILRTYDASGWENSIEALAKEFNKARHSGDGKTQLSAVEHLCEAMGSFKDFHISPQAGCDIPSEKERGTNGQLNLLRNWLAMLLDKEHRRLKRGLGQF